MCQLTLCRAKVATYYAQALAYKFPYSPRFLLESDAAQQMVWHALGFLGSDLVGDDGQAAIKLHRISIDYLTVESACYLDR